MKKAKFLFSSQFTGATDHLLMARFRALYYDTHLHDTYTLGLVRRGKAYYETFGKKFLAKPGDIFLFHPFEIHEGGNKFNKFGYDALYPSTDLINFSAKNRNEKGSCAIIGRPHIKDSAHTRKLFQVVDDYLGEGKQTSTLSHVEQALQDLLKKEELRSDESIPFEFHETVNLACKLMQSKTFSIKDIGTLHEKVNLSRYYFIRIFRKVTKLSPRQYYQQLRIANARNYIMRGFSLADAAILSEFSDQAHMTREFRAKLGFTPGEMKKGIREFIT